MPGLKRSMAAVAAACFVGAQAAAETPTDLRLLSPAIPFNCVSMTGSLSPPLDDARLKMSRPMWEGWVLTINMADQVKAMIRNLPSWQRMMDYSRQNGTEIEYVCARGIASDMRDPRQTGHNSFEFNLQDMDALQFGDFHWVPFYRAASRAMQAAGIDSKPGMPSTDRIAVALIREAAARAETFRFAIELQRQAGGRTKVLWSFINNNEGVAGRDDDLRRLAEQIIYGQEPFQKRDGDPDVLEAALDILWQRFFDNALSSPLTMIKVRKDMLDQPTQGADGRVPTGEEMFSRLIRQPRSGGDVLARARALAGQDLRTLLRPGLEI